MPSAVDTAAVTGTDTDTAAAAAAAADTVFAGDDIAALAASGL